MRWERKYISLSLSHETITMTMPFGPATFTFTAVAPPQAEQHRVYELAMFHVQAFFYLITYKEESRTGSRFPGRFAPAIEARRSDWGNGVMLGFMEAQRSWRRRILAVGADRFFKLSIRRQPGNADIWAWAVEWNQNFRVAGYFGEENLVRAAVRALPPLTVQTFAEGNGNWVLSRRDVELPEDQDRLFFDDDLDQPDYGEEQLAVTEDVGPTTSAETGPSTPAS